MAASDYAWISTAAGMPINKPNTLSPDFQDDDQYAGYGNADGDPDWPFFPVADQQTPAVSVESITPMGVGAALGLVSCGLAMCSGMLVLVFRVWCKVPVVHAFGTRRHAARSYVSSVNGMSDNDVYE
jgi:hypothetical protein